jgi:transposase
VHNVGEEDDQATRGRLQATDDLAEATRLVFQRYPQKAIFTSFPRLGELPAARLLAEIGDDSTRFADARGRAFRA